MGKRIGLNKRGWKMTRLAVLADIHSNLPALEAVLDDLKQFTVDRIIVAGDVVNWGAFSDWVMDRVADEECAVIRGNNELYLTEWQTPRMPESWKIFTLPPYTLAQLGKHCFDFGVGSSRQYGFKRTARRTMNHLDGWCIPEAQGQTVGPC